MAQQIKKKFIGNDQIDSTKIKLLQNQAVRAVDSTGTEQELIKLGATDEVLVKGQQVGLKSAIDAEVSRAQLEESSLQFQIDQEESRAMAEESSIRALISSSSSDQGQAVSDEQSRAEAAESALDSRLDALEADPTTKTYVDEEVSGLQHQIDNVLSNLDTEALDSLTEIVSAFQAMDGELEGTISSLAYSSSEAIQAEQSRAELAESSLQSAITAEISSRMADVDAEQSRAELQESSLQAQITAEISRAELEESSLQFQIEEEESRAMFAESALDSRLSSLEANPTTASYVDAQISSVQSSISQEQSRAELQESSLQSQIDQEESRAATAESSLQAQITAEISSRIVDVNAEESRAMAVESSLQSQITAEISNRVADVDSEESRAMAAESSLQQTILAEASNRAMEISEEYDSRVAADLVLQANIDDEETRAMAAEDMLDGKIDQEIFDRSEAVTLLDSRLDILEADPTTKTYVDGEVSDLQSQINSVLSNIDTEALDSLTEIVSAFQVADSSLQGAISQLANNSSGNIEAEQSRAEAVESSLQSQITAEISNRTSDVDSEESRAMAAESSLQSQITAEISNRTSDVNAEESRAIVAETSLATRITDLENVSFNKESFVVGSGGVGTSYVDLAHEVDEMSLVVFVDRLALHKEEDYTVSVVSGKTRITYTGSFASGGDEAVANGDKIFVTYSFVDAGNGGSGSTFSWNTSGKTGSGGVTAGSDGEILKTSGGSGYNVNVLSTESISDGQAFEFTIDSNFINVILGVATTVDPNGAFSSFKFGVYNAGSGGYEGIVNGSIIGSLSANFVPGDVLKFQLSGDNLIFSVNGIAKYTHTLTSSDPLYALVSIYSETKGVFQSRKV